MMIDISAKSYLALCAMVREALDDDTDANPLLQQLAKELAAGIKELPQDVLNDPKKHAALVEAGFLTDQAA